MGRVKIPGLPNPSTGRDAVFSKDGAPLYLTRYEKALATAQQRPSSGVIFEHFITGYKIR